MGFSRVRLPMLLLVVLQLLLMVASAQATNSPAKSYIVYMGGHSTGAAAVAATERISSTRTVHLNMLTTLIGSEISARESLIYSYENFNAFAAKLSPEQAASLAGQEGVVSVFPNRPKKLLTTRSWEFLGLEDSVGNAPSSSLWSKSNFGQDVIIGVLDSGVWPESKSFDDQGLGPIPDKWKGECVAGDSFGPSYCNNKLIGGRYYIEGYEAEEGPFNATAGDSGDYLSARDSEGHGTHTTSTAGGSYAPGANCLGFAPGTAKGGAPKARVAMYKVCWPSTSGSGCSAYDADIIKGFDAGISDGVDIFSVSLGGYPPSSFWEDGIAIGSFHATRSNISVVASAGNDGPSLETVTNVAPWITTVAASSIDRDFPSSATLGNNQVLRGASLSQNSLIANFYQDFYPLVSSADVFASDSNSTASELCLPGSLDPAQVEGKIVACQAGNITLAEKGEVVKNASGIGLITLNSVRRENELIVEAHVLPATQLTYADGLRVLNYIRSTVTPVAKLSPATTAFGVNPAPVVTAFSSRGPNSLVPNLLKPDVTGPGLNILAAWTQATSVTGLPRDNRTVAYKVISGTSMSCPHVAGVIASLKAYHPIWSPAALHSAIMTTGYVNDNANGRISTSVNTTATPFDFGAGHISPNFAAEPGLVYDNGPIDYTKFLCRLGYTQANISAITGNDYTCLPNEPSVSNLNYPSLTVSNLVSNLGQAATSIKRIVTNVGEATSTYTVSINSPPGIQVVISPATLTFSAVGETKTFVVNLTALQSSGGEYVFGFYTWNDGSHSVRSPIVIKTSE